MQYLIILHIYVEYFNCTKKYIVYTSDSGTQEPVTSNVPVLAREIRCAVIGENVLTVMFSPLSLRLYESVILRMCVFGNHPLWVFRPENKIRCKATDVILKNS